MAELLIEDGAVVLFQGDSITDADRDRSNPDDLGPGYPALVAALFTALHPALRVRWINRGLSGHRTSDLRARWQRDCLDLAPTWLSLLIGVNDTWWRYDYGEPTPPDVFEANYRALLEPVRAAGTRLLLMEPFLLPGVPDRTSWREDLDPKIEIVRRLAAEFDAILLPLDRRFTEVARDRPAAEWMPDGVHPTAAGHALIASTWLRAVGA